MTGVEADPGAPEPADGGAAAEPGTGGGQSSDVAADGPDGLPLVEVEAAAAVRRLGEGLLGRSVDPERSAEVVARLGELIELVEACPRRTKVEAFGRYPGHSRITEFVATGEWPAPPPNGGELTFDALSFVGGKLNPFSGGTRYYRDGDEAVARTRFSVCYEGPPSRVHGGMIAAAFDEVMGAVFRVGALPNSFTGTLTVRYLRPAPLDTDVEFRAGLAGSQGRKHTVTGSATGPDGPFAEAEAIFIEMTPEQYTEAVAVDPATGHPTSP